MVSTIKISFLFIAIIIVFVETRTINLLSSPQEGNPEDWSRDLEVYSLGEVVLDEDFPSAGPFFPLYAKEGSDYESGSEWEDTEEEIYIYEEEEMKDEVYISEEEVEDETEKEEDMKTDDQLEANQPLEGETARDFTDHAPAGALEDDAAEKTLKEGPPKVEAEGRLLHGVFLRRDNGCYRTIKDKWMSMIGWIKYLFIGVSISFVALVIAVLR